MSADVDAGPAPAAAGPRRARELRVWGPTAVALWAAHLAVVLLVPDAAGARTAPAAPRAGAVALLLAGLVAWLAAALVRPASSAARALVHRLPWFALCGAWFIVWQLTTVKTTLLRPPYFAAPEVLIAALVEDWGLLLKCLVSSGLLFLTGYAIGSAAGFLTGFYMGWSRRGDYWLHPVLQTVGPVPAAALLPLAVLVVPTTYLSAASIVAFGAWAGVRAVPRSFIDVARTLGADESFLVRRIAIPSALPDMLTGLFTGLGTSLAALMTAELVGVDQGLAWYINWVKGWADYPKMYVGLTVLVLFCRALMLLLFKIRSSLLAWQRDLVWW